MPFLPTSRFVTQSYASAVRLQAVLRFRAKQQRAAQAANARPTPRPLAPALRVRPTALAAANATHAAVKRWAAEEVRAAAAASAVGHAARPVHKARISVLGALRSGARESKLLHYGIAPDDDVRSRREVSGKPRAR